MFLEIKLLQSFQKKTFTANTQLFGLCPYYSFSYKLKQHWGALKQSNLTCKQYQHSFPRLRNDRVFNCYLSYHVYLVSMLVEAILNICKYMNSFYSSKRDNIVYYILTIQLLRDTKKCLAVVHIVIQNGSNNGHIHKSLKCYIQNFKNSLKNIKST